MRKTAAANKRVTKDSREQADLLNAPSYSPDDDIPFAVASVVPLSIEIREPQPMSSGAIVTDRIQKLDATSIQIKLPKQILTKDKTFGYEDRIYVQKLPFRTDINDMVRDGHTSQDVVRALIADPNYGHSFDLLEIKKEDIKSFNALARDRDFRSQMDARKNVASQNLLAINALSSGIETSVAPPEINVPA